MNKEKYQGSIVLLPLVVVLAIGVVGIIVLSSISSNREKSIAPEESQAAAIFLPPAEEEYFLNTPEDAFDEQSASTTPLTTKSVAINLNVSKLSQMRHNASGFLVSSIPLDASHSVATDLKPSLYRTQSDLLAPQNDRNYQIFHEEAGSDFQIFMGADYLNQNVWCNECKGREVWPGANGNWQPWENSMRTIMDKIIGGNYDVEYDIWNEPNVAFFWGPQSDINRFYQTWKRAFTIIRQKDPDAKIVGPSISRYDKTWLVNFLNFAKANNVVPNILSWHELDHVPKATQIESNVRDIKNWMNSNGVKVEAISLNEILPANSRITSQFDSGLFIKYALALEKSLVRSSTKSCWPEDGTDERTTNCFTPTLDGLLTKDTYQKRGFWYTYKAYADMTGLLLGITQPTNGLSAIASYNEPNGETHVLLGNSSSVSYNVNAKLTSLGSVGRPAKNYIKVTIQNIPSSGKQALASLPSEVVYNYYNTSGTINLAFPGMSGFGAYKVVLSTPTFTYNQLMPNVAVETCTSTTAPTISVGWTKGNRPDSKVRVTFDGDKNASNGYYYKDIPAGSTNIVSGKFTGAGALAGKTLTLAKNKQYNVSIKHIVTNETSPWKTFSISPTCTIL